MTPNPLSLNIYNTMVYIKIIKKYDCSFVDRLLNCSVYFSNIAHKICHDRTMSYKPKASPTRDTSDREDIDFSLKL